jgi:hypothetical protein
MKYFLLLTLSVMLFSPEFLSAQKLINVQERSIHLPVTVKIDGKSTEWSNFEAYNKSTEVYYTVANDESRLYFILKSKDAIISKKIIVGGLTLTINKEAKRNSDKKVTVIFPWYDANDKAFLGNLITQPSEKGIDSVSTARKADSLMKYTNREFSKRLKEIKVTGIDMLIDSVISVYNSEGIRVSALLDAKKCLTYELSIPMKYLRLETSAKVFYNIMLNGTSGREIMVKPNQYGIVSVRTIFGGGMGSNENVRQVLESPTDFWGEYVLYK